jgi:hypothetical protein
VLVLVDQAVENGSSADPLGVKVIVVRARGRRPANTRQAWCLYRAVSSLVTFGDRELSRSSNSTGLGACDPVIPGCFKIVVTVV